MRSHRITVGLKESSYRALKEVCEETGDSMSETVAELVEASEGVLVRIAAFSRMARESRETWKEKTAKSLGEIQAELEPLLARGLRLLGEGATEEGEGEGPQLRPIEGGVRGRRKGANPHRDNNGGQVGDKR